MILNTNRSLMQLVSYPRTGSHWFRVIMEQYLSRPCLPDSFFNTDLNNPWAYHLHDRIVGFGDEGYTNNFDKVIYLYRNPVDTIYSMMRYEKNDDWKQFVTEYKTHLQRWLHNHDDCKNYIAVKYEDIQKDYGKVFKCVLDYMDEEYNKDLLDVCYNKTTHELVKSLTSHDDQIVNQDIFSGDYNITKAEFVTECKQHIIEMFDGIYE